MQCSSSHAFLDLYSLRLLAAATVRFLEYFWQCVWSSYISVIFQDSCMRCLDLPSQNPPGRYVYVFFLHHVLTLTPGYVIGFKLALIPIFILCTVGTNHGQTHCQDHVLRLQNGWYHGRRSFMWEFLSLLFFFCKDSSSILCLYLGIT